MSSTVKRYQRVSVTRADGRKVPYDARVDIDVDVARGTVVYRVHSQALTDRHVRVVSTGNAAEDMEALESACQRVYDFDQGYRVKAWPKPEKTATPAVCDRCGGDGWFEDETGYPLKCECRR